MKNWAINCTYADDPSITKGIMNFLFKVWCISIVLAQYFTIPCLSVVPYDPSSTTANELKMTWLSPTVKPEGLIINAGNTMGALLYALDYIETHETLLPNYTFA